MKAWRTSRGLIGCSGCRQSISVTVGTVFEDSRLPLRTWFRAAWWITNQKSGVNALGLQRLLGLGSYKTAWTCLHKLRRAMLRPGREPLSGRVEVDEAFWGARGRGSPSHHKKTIVIIAAEIRGNKTGRVRLQRIPDDSEHSIVGFVRKNVCPGSELVTDGAHAYKALLAHGYRHDRTVLEDKGRHGYLVALPRVHHTASLLKRWLMGTYHGRTSTAQFDHYLDEFAFRFNRRSSTARGMLFHRLLQNCVALPPSPYKELRG